MALSICSLQTQQSIVDAIDIVGWSRQIILGQIGTNNSMSNETLTNSTSEHISKHPYHVLHVGGSTCEQWYLALLSRLAKACGWSNQGGPGQPCLDESCCSKEGRCGYKEFQYRVDNCISNYQARQCVVSTRRMARHRAG